VEGISPDDRAGIWPDRKVWCQGIDSDSLQLTRNVLLDAPVSRGTPVALAPLSRARGMEF